MNPRWTKFIVALLSLTATTLWAGNIVYLRLERDVVQAKLKVSPVEPKDRLARLRAMFHEAGCVGKELVEQPVRGQSLPNLICNAPGMARNVTIVVGARYDDAWETAAILPLLYESINGAQRRHSFVFIALSPDSDGRASAKEYLKRRSRKQRISAMIGLQELRHGEINIAVGPRHRELATPLELAAQGFHVAYTPNIAQYRRRPATLGFEDAQVPSATLFAISNPVGINSDSTNSSSTNFASASKASTNKEDSYYENYNVISIYLGYLDNLLDQPGRSIWIQP